MKKLITLFKRFSEWFDYNFGVFFVNGNKYDKWNTYITYLKQKKSNTKNHGK